MVSYYLPPVNEPRAIQVGNLLGCLEEPLLVAHGQDRRRSPDPTLGLSLANPLSRLLPVPFRPNPLGERLEYRASQRNLPLAGRAPDRLWTWRRPALKAILAELKALPWRPRALLTFGQPWTTHLVGLGLYRALGLPWLAHFSDLWSDWPFGPPDPLTKWYNRHLEAQVVAAASRVLFTSPETLELVMAKYPASLGAKAQVLSHSYRPQDYPPPPAPGPPRRVLRYLGSFYGRRQPSLLIAPLLLLAQRRPELLRDLSIEIIGDYQPPAQDNPFAALPPGLVSFHPPIPHGRCLELMVQAEALLVIEFPVPRSVWLPSKIIEYMGAGRPVLGLAPAGASRRVILELGGWCADPADPEAVATMLADYLSRPAPPQPWGDQAVRQSYLAEQQARRLLEQVDLALAGAATSG